MNGRRQKRKSNNKIKKNYCDFIFLFTISDRKLENFIELKIEKFHHVYYKFMIEKK